jgi:hypothetical protein
MNRPLLSIHRLERQLWTGNIETLTFQAGVNLVTGPPNTGKTNWLRMLDYIFGETSPFEAAFEDELLKNTSQHPPRLRSATRVFTFSGAGEKQGQKPRYLSTRPRCRFGNFSLG